MLDGFDEIADGLRRTRSRTILRLDAGRRCGLTPAIIQVL